MKTFKPSIFSAAALIVLAGCGGSHHSKPPLEGAFTGSFSNSVLLTDLVLENGAFWSVYGPNPDDIHGFSAGHVNSDDGKFTASFTTFEKPGNNPTPGNGSGVYTPSSVAGSVTQAGETLSFNATAIPAKNYIYKTPASITSIVGSWSGKLLNNEEGSVHILADGIFSGGSSGGCKFTGKFFPTHVNAFKVSITFGGAPCAFPGETASGIALTTLRDDGKNQLIIALVNASKRAGSLFYAKR